MLRRRSRSLGTLPSLVALLGVGCRRQPLSSSSQPETYYTLLGVPSTAQPQEIKEAFRKKAKLLHPDAQSQHGRADQAAFVQLLTAYQILSNARARELYDLSISSNQSELLRKAAAAGVQGGAVDEDVEINMSWGLGSLFKPPADSQSNNMLDRVRSELKSDLHAALRHAYLGPKLELQDEHQLPDCFEADERSHSQSPDLLELVSGRQLLGVVRERRAAELAGMPGQQGTLPGAPTEGSPAGMLAAAPAAAAALRGAAGAGQEVALAGHGAEPGCMPAGAAGNGTCGNSSNSGSNSSSSSSSNGDSGNSSSAGSDTGQASMGSGPTASSSSQAGGAKGEVEVLELIVGEDLVVWAARHKEPKEAPGGAAPWSAAGAAASAAATAAVASKPPQPEAAAAGRDATGASAAEDSSSPSPAAAAQRQQQPGEGGGPAGELSNKNAGAHSGRVASPHEAQQQQQQEADEEGEVTVVSFYRGGRLLGRLLGEQSAAASNAPSAARFLDADGVHTHTVLRSSSPLVRHLSVVAEPATGLAPTRRSRATVFRARRAWLPPSALWLFRPRNYDHDIGGWYMEWVGHGSSGHPAWLDPAVCVLAAGFDTLDHERARQQPQGLFGRMRVGDELQGGALSWVRAMLRFHGVRK